MRLEAVDPGCEEMMDKPKKVKRQSSIPCVFCDEKALPSSMRKCDGVLAKHCHSCHKLICR